MNETDEQLSNELVVLDKLISSCFDAILKETTKAAKLGDLLKMIELRRKLTPNEEDQKRFWSMLESVRRKHLDTKDPAIKADSASSITEHLLQRDKNEEK